MKKMIRGVCGFLALTCGLLMGAIITLSHQLPEQFSVVEGTPLNLNGAVEAGAPRSASGQTVETASLTAGSSYTAPLRLFGMFPVRNVAVKVVDLPVVVPCGTPFGIKMFTDGVLVVGMSDVDTASGSHNPARSTVKAANTADSANVFGNILAFLGAWMILLGAWIRRKTTK